MMVLLSVGVQSALAETVSGQVTDDGKAMPEAYVALYLGSGNVIIDAKNTDKEGHYQFTTTQGVYNVCVSVSGYEYECAKGIELQGKDVTANVKMTPSAFVEKKGDQSSDGCD